MSQRSADLTGANQSNLVARHGNLSFEPEREEEGKAGVLVIAFEEGVQVAEGAIASRPLPRV